SIAGSVPRPDEVASVCTFSARCRWATPVCRAGKPPLVTVAPGRQSACVRIEEIRTELLAAREAAQRSAHVAAAGSAQEAVLRITDLRKVFEPSGRGGAPVVAVDGVSLEVG